MANQFNIFIKARFYKINLHFYMLFILSLQNCLLKLYELLRMSY